MSGQPSISLKTFLCGAFILCASESTPVSAAEAQSFCLIVSCKNDAAAVEIYAPSSICSAGVDDFFKGLEKENRGYYALDLNQLGKGKPLEPVHLKAAGSNEGIEVDQFTRGLPPAVVPKEGGNVSFDERFATNMTCSPLFDTMAPEMRSAE